MWPCLFERIKTKKSLRALLPCFSEWKMVASVSWWFHTSLEGGLLGMPNPLFWVVLALCMCSHTEIATWYCKLLFTHLVSQMSVISWRAPSTCLAHRRNPWNVGWISATLCQGEGHVFNQKALSPAGQRFPVLEKTWVNSENVGCVTACSTIPKFYPKVQFGTALPKLQKTRMTS